ncbi:YheC/YheD family protein [Brevibacillus ginsengisoli]|uniref:YheC/YheD family endospore coat-associated protein n=1 Tax=Brevibacillus ginsengisoli TaxID=363854 RepID=UPI003CF84846
MGQIGILLDWKVLQRAIEGKSTFERLNYYEEIGKELNLFPVFFHPLHVDFTRNKVRGYRYRNGKLVRHKTKLPKIIHNRVLTGDNKTNQAIQRLGRIGKVYNGIVARNKSTVHRLLIRNPNLRKYLPQTSLYTKDNLVRFLQGNPVVYVKPVVGSVGKGVARIERQGDNYLFVAAGKRAVLSKYGVVTEAGRWVSGRRFLVQQGIPLARYHGRTFDIRVSVQKDGNREWNVSGLVCKVANPQNKLSNLSRGGKAEPIDRVLLDLFDSNLKVQEIKKRISQAAIEIAQQLNKFYPSLADLGMDMGIDREGNPYLIEVNVRDQRYSFYKAGSIGMFKETYRRPMAYGKSFLS